jgi:hypothetical protein
MGNIRESNVWMYFVCVCVCVRACMNTCTNTNTYKYAIFSDLYTLG